MKITLVCYAGMSTGLMKLKLEQEAAKAGRDDVVIDAIAIAEAENDLGDADVFLLGPQVRYAMDELTQKVGGRPVLQISTPDFGMMRADNVWKQIEAALQ